MISMRIRAVALTSATAAALTACSSGHAHGSVSTPRSTSAVPPSTATPPSTAAAASGPAVLQVTVQLHGAVAASASYVATAKQASSCADLAQNGSEGSSKTFAVPGPLAADYDEPALPASLRSPPVSIGLYVQPYSGPQSYDPTHGMQGAQFLDSLTTNPLAAKQVHYDAMTSSTESVTVNSDGSGSASFEGWTDRHGGGTAGGSLHWTCGAGTVPSRTTGAALLHVVFQLHGAAERSGRYDALIQLASTCQQLSSGGTAAQTGGTPQFEVAFPEGVNGIATSNVSAALTTPPIDGFLRAQPYHGPGTYSGSQIASGGEVTIDPNAVSPAIYHAIRTNPGSVTVNADGSGSASWSGWLDLDTNATVSGRITWTCSDG
jgi:hypothetical protein